MTMSDPLGDMLTRIRNGQKARKKSVRVWASNANRRVLQVLKDEGYIRDSRDVENEIEVELKYEQGTPVIKEIERVSRPGRRVYSSVKTMPKFYNGLGVLIVSTSRGVMADRQAREENLGGEILGRVY